MNIVDETKQVTVKFKDIEPGQVFISDDRVFIKTGIKEKFVGADGGEVVDLRTGDTLFVADIANVYLVDATLTISRMS